MENYKNKKYFDVNKSALQRSLDTHELISASDDLYSKVKKLYHTINEGNRDLFYEESNQYSKNEKTNIAIIESNINFFQSTFISEIKMKFDKNLMAKLNIFDSIQITLKIGAAYTVENTTPELLSDSTGNYFSVYINKNINGLILPSGFSIIDITVLKINDIDIFDILDSRSNLLLTIEKYHDYYSEVRENYERDISLKNSEHKSIMSSIEIAIDEQKRVENIIIESNDFLEKVRRDIENSNTTTSDLRMEIKSLKQNIQDETNISNRVKSEIKHEEIKLEATRNTRASAEEKLIDINSQLSEAEKNLNLYTFDMQGFDKESKFQLNKYYLGVGIILSMLFIIFSIMYFNAKSFSDLIDTSWKVSTWDILLSRLPLFTATALIIGTLSGLLFFLVNHIISLNTDKMNMLKASILAEQITGTS
jgi:hypothetical protein